MASRLTTRSNAPSSKGIRCAPADGAFYCFFSVQDAIAALARNKAELRHRVSRELTLKYAPDLRFRPDETFDRLDESRRLFSDPTVRRDIERPDSESPDEGA